MSVSRVINDNPSVKAETRARVIKAIAKSAMRQRRRADAQRAKRTDNRLVVPDLSITLQVASMQSRRLPSSITIRLSWLRREE